jgi:hypothetical protein
MMIPAECHSDDYNVECKFDAVDWFKQAKPDQIVALASCGWGGDYPADEVAIWQADRDPEIAFMFKYLQAIRNDRTKKDLRGFECHVAPAEAREWLKTNAPTVLAEIEHE